MTKQTLRIVATLIAVTAIGCSATKRNSANGGNGVDTNNDSSVAAIQSVGGTWGIEKVEAFHMHNTKGGMSESTEEGFKRSEVENFPARGSILSLDQDNNAQILVNENVSFVQNEDMISAVYSQNGINISLSKKEEMKQKEAQTEDTEANDSEKADDTQGSDESVVTETSFGLFQDAPSTEGSEGEEKVADTTEATDSEEATSEEEQTESKPAPVALSMGGFSYEIVSFTLNNDTGLLSLIVKLDGQGKRNRGEIFFKRFEDQIKDADTALAASKEATTLALQSSEEAALEFSTAQEAAENTKTANDTQITALEQKIASAQATVASAESNAELKRFANEQIASLQAEIDALNANTQAMNDAVEAASKKSEAAKKAHSAASDAESIAQARREELAQIEEALKLASPDVAATPEVDAETVETPAPAATPEVDVETVETPAPVTTPEVETETVVETADVDTQS